MIETLPEIEPIKNLAKKSMRLEINPKIPASMPTLVRLLPFQRWVILFIKNGNIVIILLKSISTSITESSDNKKLNLLMHIILGKLHLFEVYLKINVIF